MDTPFFGIVVPQGDSREIPNMDNIETLPLGIQSPNLNEDIVEVPTEPPAAQPDPPSEEEEKASIPPEVKTPDIKPTVPVSPASSTLKDMLQEQVKCLEFVLS